MASFLRKLRPSVLSSSSVHDDGDDYSVEYSFAIEYNGPPLSFSIPEATPFKIEQIPLASVAPSFSTALFPVPIIQPIVKTNTNVKLDTNSKSPATTELAISGSSELTNSESFSIRVESSSRVNKSCSLNRTDDADKCSSAGNSSQRLQISGSFGVSGRGEIWQVLPESEMNPTNSDKTESGSTSCSVSSETFSCREDDCNNDTPRHVRRPSAVTFLDPESDHMVVNENFDGSQAASTPIGPRVERLGKKGTCYRCNGGNRFTEKEVCIVCSAKFCRKCVLRAMGCMPEGRKCITCIGCRIDENKRRTQGKCSRVLKQLLSEQEVKQIMHAELNCETNQIPPELVYVNEENLDRDQLILLQSCPKPPRKLKPGSYWYDKASGFWGKEGQAPCQIISPQLDVGGTLQRHASNGNTKVHINGREITKKELRMLKIAGVPCEGTPNFWVSADGSYQEEGQKNVKERRIWDKTTVRLLCMVLSMPVPSNSVAASGEGEGENKVKGSFEQRNLYKFLLVGSIKSGTSTIFKQARDLYNVPFTEDERQNIKLVIQSNLYTYLAILLEGREIFEEESLLEKRKRQLVDESTSAATGNTDEITDTTTIYSIGSRLKDFSDRLLKYMVSGNLDAIFPDSTWECASLVEELWSDAAIQATYNRRNELEMLPRGASYFLDRAVEISKVDYEPSDTDIMYAEGITLSNSLTSVEFSFPKTSHEDSLDPAYQHDPSLIYQLIRVHPRSLGENCKWLEMFEEIDVVIFCVALTDYDEYTVDRNGVSTNKMLAAKQLFENIITHPSFANKKFLLILTKFDLLEEKIDVVPLTECEWFSDFNPVISNNQNRSNNYTTNPPLVQRAFQYIAVKFKKLCYSLTSQKLFVSLVNGLEPDTVDESLRYAREIMLWQKWFPSLSADQKSENEITTTSYDEQSS
ncbi:extra-large guanine nucleotide-binding protein 1-like [Senna tora]|uniref:Extra-large guanine nucleotide-binding protein 1-like n=1 Tax=Senna tora TaxID=362788 RepID=A0A834WBB1_9FABA|nr:extra-large guanine nucleotide-binding protein 1-like [Senna tora]